MSRRGVDIASVRQVLYQPEAIVPGRAGRVVVQARIPMGPAEKVYLVRVVVDVDRRPAEVVTVYRTTKFARYGSNP